MHAALLVRAVLFPSMLFLYLHFIWVKRPGLSSLKTGRVAYPCCEQHFNRPRFTSLQLDQTTRHDHRDDQAALLVNRLPLIHLHLASLQFSAVGSNDPDSPP